MSNRSEQKARNRRYTDTEVRLLLESAQRLNAICDEIARHLADAHEETSRQDSSEG